MPSRNITTDSKSGPFRLETPAMTGYRAGTSSSGLIGRKLGRLYHPPTETPNEIDNLLQLIDRKLMRGD